MNQVIALFLAFGVTSGALAAQQPSESAQISCCQRVEITANKSSGYVGVPAYLAVWVEPSSRHWAFDPSFLSEAREAFGIWSDAGVPVVFDFTSDSARATVRILWRNRFREALVGRSTWWTADGRLGSVDIEVALGALPGVDAPRIRRVVMHEIGHLLGFSHTSEPDSIMSYYVSNPELSTRDIARMRQRFALPAPQR